MMPIDRPTGQAIAALMAALRTDWDQPGCLKAVADIKGRNPYDAALAAVRCAADPKNRTPAVLRLDGEHWRDRIVAAAPRQPPRQREECTRHLGEHRDWCRGCATEHLDEDPSKSGPPSTSVAPSDEYRAARAQIRPAPADTATEEDA